MKPLTFPQQTQVFAKDQPEYLPLPAHVNATPDGTVTTLWGLTWRERFKVLLTGRLWLQQLAFHSRLQPQLPTVDSPFEESA